MEDHIKAIVQRLAGLREVMQLSIEDFAEKCQIDAETYRKVESGENDISVTMLQKIAREHHISLDELLFGTEPRTNKYFVTRSGRGFAIERVKAYRYQSLAAGFKGRVMTPLLVSVDPNDRPITLNQHDGQEFDAVVSGELLIHIDGHEVVLREGDTIYFDARLKHGMKALNQQPAKFLAIII